MTSLTFAGETGAAGARRAVGAPLPSSPPLPGGGVAGGRDTALTHSHTHTHIYTRTRSHTHGHAHTHAHTMHTPINSYTDTQTHGHTHVRTDAHPYAPIRTPIPTHTHVHTHTHPGLPPKSPPKAGSRTGPRRRARLDSVLLTPVPPRLLPAAAGARFTRKTRCFGAAAPHNEIRAPDAPRLGFSVLFGPSRPRPTGRAPRIGPGPPPEWVPGSCGHPHPRLGTGGPAAPLGSDPRGGPRCPVPALILRAGTPLCPP